MGQHPETEDVDVSSGDEEVPEEIACGKSLYHARAARVAPETLSPIHLPPLLVDVDYPQGQGADDGALDEGDDVDVPVQLPGLGQSAVLGWIEARRQHGRDDAAHELVEDGYYDHFMDVQRQRRQVEIVGPWLYGVGEGGNRRYWERILHAEGRRLSKSVFVYVATRAFDRGQAP